MRAASIRRFYSVDRHALKNRFKELIPSKQAEVKEIKAKHGDKMMGTIADSFHEHLVLHFGCP